MRRERRLRPVRRAFVVKLVLALVIGAVGTLAPVPAVRTERAMATETRSPVAEGATVQPAPIPPAADADGPPARVRIAEDTRDFDIIGVTLPEPPVAPVLVRTATDDGGWGSWTELEFDSEAAGPAPAPVPGADVPPESFRPVAGDFDADGDDDIALSRNGRSTSVWTSNNARFTSRLVLPTYGSFVPIAGDYDADGDDDIMWYAPGTAADFVWTSTGGMSFSWSDAPPVHGYYTSVVAGDFDADGGDDLFWYLSPGDDSIWWHTTQMFGRMAWTNIQFR